MPKRTGAGAATAAGTKFQEDVAAWLTVQVLAENAAPILFGLPDGVLIDSLIAESFKPVDDLQVATSAGGEIFLQCKTALSLSDQESSELGCLHDFAKRLFNADEACILIEAEFLDTGSQRSLAFGLGLREGVDLAEVLSAWPVKISPTGDRLPCYLIIDALDAARGRSSLSTICELIRTVHEQAPDWHVVASIREFDLRHSEKVKELFPGNPHTELHSDLFPEVRHIHVPRLTEDEIAIARDQCPPLNAALSQQHEELIDLVANPFNLRLLIEILGLDASADELDAIRMRTDLLDLYWKKRVKDKDPTDALERAAGVLIEEMKKQRSLSVDRSDIEGRPAVTPEALPNLLSRGVVRSEPRRAALATTEYLSFSHNILFDYAVAKLWLRDLPNSVLEELANLNGQDLVLFVRPSLILTFEALWYQDETKGTGAAPNHKV